MDNWLVRIHTVGLLSAFPQAFTVAVETRDTASYYHAGKTRGGENHCLFQYTLSGEGVFENSSGLWRVGKGRGFLCEVAAPDSVYYYPEDGHEPWTFMYVPFGGETAFDMVRQMTSRFGPIFDISSRDPIIRRFLGMGENVQEGLSFSFDCGPPPTQLKSSRKELTLAENSMLVMNLLSALLKGREDSESENSANALVRRAVALIDEHIEKNINVSELAEMLDISREHLTRVFREQTGRSPHKYLTRQKMLAACTLLKDSTLSIKEMSLRLGFDSAAHFSRTFRSAIGSSPREFRENGQIPAL